MPPFRRLTRSFFASLLLASSIAYAATPDEAFQAARKAYKDGDVATLEANLPLLREHELLPYVEYWRLSMDIEQAWPNQIQAFLSEVDGMLVAERMRAKWLRELARREQWTDFLTMSRELSTWDAELTCYSLQARIALGETGALEEARDLWFTGRPQPESCLPLFESLFEQNVLGTDAVWARFRLALNRGNRSVAKAILKYVPAAERPSSRKRAHPPVASSPRVRPSSRPTRECRCVRRGDRSDTRFGSDVHVHRRRDMTSPAPPRP